MWERAVPSTSSADLEFAEGGQTTLHHSFQTSTLVLEAREKGEILRGPVKVHREDMLDIARLDLEIPDSSELLATYTFYRLTQLGRQDAATFTFPLQRVSSFFRRVELEIDQVEGVPLPREFRTDQHAETPATVSPQTLTVDAVFRNAGGWTWRRPSAARTRSTWRAPAARGPTRSCTGR